MLKPALMGIARHVFSLAAGALVARGVIDAAQADVLIGAAIGIATVALSVIEKRRR